MKKHGSLSFLMALLLLIFYVCSGASQIFAAEQPAAEQSATVPNTPREGGEMGALAPEDKQEESPKADIEKSAETPKPAVQEAAPASAQRRSPLKVSDKSILPLRVLTRPMASLYKNPDTGSEVIQSNLPVFMPYYVYARPGGEDIAAETGWYEVGLDNRGAVAGWIKSSDVFEWKQTMCLTYTHPEQRKPVLMFEKEKPLADIIAKAPDARAADAQALYATIDTGNIPKDFSIVSVEPKMAVDLTRQFYLLPILDYKVVNLDGREARMLELVAVSAGGEDAREKTDIRHNTQFAGRAIQSSGDAAGAVSRTLKVDIVWAVDTTRSMGPYIERTKDVIKTVSAQLAKTPDIGENIRFGVWGFRDSVIDIPAIEYITKNFTPQLQDVKLFLQTMDSVKETKIDSIDFPEDVFSGVSDAITATKWTPGAVRFVVLVGDAPGHELGHKWNASGYDATTLRTLATENNVTLLAIQIRPKGAKNFQVTAEEQFKTLSLNPGTDTSAYYSLQGTEIPAFAATTTTIVDSLQGVLRKASDRTLGTAINNNESLVVQSGATGIAQDSKGPVSAESAKAMQVGNTGLDQALKAAVVQWIGREAEAKPPRDIVAWVVDKDLMDTAKQSLEVRLLISKQQLDSLATLLNDVIAAGRTGQISGDSFFTSLQAASAVASRDPNMLKNAKSLGQSGLIPGFLEGLPYHSRLMDMSNALWESWNTTEQDHFLSELDARIRAYKALHDTPQGWIKLNQGADADESVYPIPLDLLP